MRNIAITIGVQEYEFLIPLKYTANDAKKIVEKILLLRTQADEWPILIFSVAHIFSLQKLQMMQNEANFSQLFSLSQKKLKPRYIKKILVEKKLYESIKQRKGHKLSQ